MRAATAAMIALPCRASTTQTYSQPMAEITVQRAIEIALQHQRLGRRAEAEDIFRQLQTVVGNNPVALNGLGMHALQAALHMTALRLFDCAVALQPANPEYLLNLASAHRAAGNLAQTIELLHQLIVRCPTFGGAYLELGRTFQGMKQFNRAVDAYARAMDFQFANTDSRTTAGEGLLETEMNAEAIACFRQAIELDPNNILAHCSLACALLYLGQADEAIVLHRKAIQLSPDDRIHYDNLLNSMRLSDSVGVEELLVEHQKWAVRFADRLAKFIPIRQNDPSPDRILRIGYVSPDLRSHPVGAFLINILLGHDREQFHITCYSNSAIEDEMTRSIRAAVQGWHVTPDWTDERSAAQIIEDRIDILIDLAQHTAGNRILLFARKPAPVQITYLGYPGTTGLKTFDAQISDPRIDPFDRALFEPEPQSRRQSGPPGQTEQYSTEPIERLPQTYWCFRPIANAPPLQPPPALAAGHITFACINKLEKSSPSAMRLWSKILNRVAGSRLLLIAPPGAHRRRIFDLFKSEGVDPDRVELVPKQPIREYFAFLQRIDIALDPIPYNGGTTTCHALWMGVPVVTLAGTAGVQRSGMSLLTNAGLPELVATTQDQYVEIAAELAGDLPRLEALKVNMRERMLASPLMDMPGFVRNLEAIYRKLWREWCCRQHEHP